MLKKRLKQSVYTDIQKSEQGFTLISMLITITILFTTLPLFVYLTKSVTYTSSYTEISIQQFFYYLRNELIEAKEFHVEENKIVLYLQNDTTASISMYETLIRRQVDGRGHEVFLRDVQRLSFTLLPYGVQAAVISTQGDRYEKTIIFYQ